jgi:hypothetical protein
LIATRGSLTFKAEEILMKRNATVTARYCAMIALGLLGYGCSSESTSDDGGAADGGEGGTDAGQGGTPDGTPDSGPDGTSDTGQGGTPDGGRDGAADGSRDGSADSSEGGLPMCSPAPADMSPCNSNPSCIEGCGVDISALSTSRPQRTCTCSGSTASGGRWSCPGSGGACVYPTDVDLSCLQLPTPLPACPLETPDGGSADSGAADGGASLVRTGTSACALPSSEVCGGVCGSATPTVFSFKDSTGMAKAGYCACIAGIWQCASVSEWPTFGGG